jgi:hypothetical protein
MIPQIGKIRRAISCESDRVRMRYSAMQIYRYKVEL